MSMLIETKKMDMSKDSTQMVKLGMERGKNQCRYVSRNSINKKGGANKIPENYNQKKFNA